MLPYDAPSVSVTETDDVDEQCHSLTWWDQDYAQLSSGRFHGRTTDVDFGPVRIFREQLSARTEQVFAPPSGTVSFSLVFESRGPSRLGGTDVGPRNFCILPGGREFHAVTAQESDVLCVEVDSALLGDGRECLEQGRRSPPVWRAERAPQVAWWLRSVLECCAKGQGAPLGEADLGMLADMAVESCRALLCEGSRGDSAADRRGARFDLVMRARDLALEALPETLEVEALAQNLRVSVRLLEDAFHDIVGLGPATWLRLLRLNRAHRDLRRMSPDSATVAEIAMQWGFWHLGRFSGYYRQLFGCSPSETLRR